VTLEDHARVLLDYNISLDILELRLIVYITTLHVNIERHAKKGHVR